MRPSSRKRPWRAKKSSIGASRILAVTLSASSLPVALIAFRYCVTDE